MATPTISLAPWGGQSLIPGLRLTARGRAALAGSLPLLLVALALAGIFGWARAEPAATDPGVDGAVVVAPARGPLVFDGRTEVYTVDAGDTLWDLAARLAPGEDPRPAVDLIKRLNGLASSSLTVGQQIVLPVR